MADVNVTELRRIAEQATPGPWDWWRNDSGVLEVFVPDGTMGAVVLLSFADYTDCEDCGRPAVADMDLMVAARNALPVLLDRLEAAEAVVHQVRVLIATVRALQPADPDTGDRDVSFFALLDAIEPDDADVPASKETNHE